MIERFRSPRPDRVPNRSYAAKYRADTGGVFRPDWRMQDPSRDPREPFGSESSGTGNDHGWSNCTMVAAALAYAYEGKKQSGPQGGDFRHNQDDMSGGTDLYDAKTAWQRYGGAVLNIQSGAGWAAVERAHGDGLAIVVQGEGNVPGAEGFDGSHACCIGCETNSDGKWLWGDPLADGWQWATSSSIREWAQALNYNILFAVGNTPISGGGSEDVANAVIQERNQIGDVAQGVDFYEAPGGARIGEMSKAFSGLKIIGVPMDASADHLNLGWRAVVVSTGAIDGVQANKVVYIMTEQITNQRAPAPVEPVPAPDTEYEIAPELYIRKP